MRRLTNLVLLKLAQNTLTGCLPVGLSDVADNDLSLLELPECAPLTNPDRLVLELFYRATNGPNWEFTGTWMTDVPLEDWLGVDTDAQGRVTALELDHRELTGIIPAELGDLEQLESLRFAESEFTGTIPVEIGDLQLLFSLHLQDNQLTGSIPMELGELPLLDWVYLSGNMLTGCIPAKLNEVTNSDLAQLNLPECPAPEPELE